MKLAPSASRGFCACMVGLNLMAAIMLASFVLPIPLPKVEALQSSSTVARRPVEPVIVPAIIGQPVRVEVPDVDVDLSVVPGSFDENLGDRTLSYESALHADSSMPINDSNGVSLVYAHALPGLFASLTGLVPGMAASITTDNQYVFKYRFVSGVEVLPTDVSVFTAEGPPILVLQTCSGAWDTHRTLYYFELTDVQKL